MKRSLLLFCMVAGCGSADKLCSREYPALSCTETFTYDGDRLVRIEGCGTTEELSYDGDRLDVIKGTGAGSAYQVEHRYEAGRLAQIRFTPTPVVEIDISYDDRGREVGRSVGPLPELEIAYAYGSDGLATETWTFGRDSETAMATYSYDGGRLVRIEEVGFDGRPFYYAFDREIPQVLATQPSSWSVLVEYDDDDRERRRTWDASGEFFGYVNTYGSCAP